MSDYRSLLSPRTANVVQDASFLRRMFAFLFDFALIDLFIAAPFASLFENLVTRTEREGYIGLVYTHQEIAAATLLFAVIFFYFVLFEYLLQQTPGMMLLNTKVEGQPGLARVLLRNSFILPVFPFIILWFVEPLTIILRKRSVLEQLTNTRTLYQRKIIM